MYKNHRNGSPSALWICPTNFIFAGGSGGTQRKKAWNHSRKYWQPSGTNQPTLLFPNIGQKSWAHLFQGTNPSIDASSEPPFESGHLCNYLGAIRALQYAAPTWTEICVDVAAGCEYKYAALEPVVISAPCRRPTTTTPSRRTSTVCAEGTSGVSRSATSSGTCTEEVVAILVGARHSRLRCAAPPSPHSTCAAHPVSACFVLLQRQCVRLNYPLVCGRPRIASVGSTLRRTPSL